MSPAHLHAARGAVKRSAATRGRLRGQSPAERDDELRARLAELSAVAAPINATLRSGPLTGRRSRNADARAVAAAIGAERSKLRGMLRRASGAPKEPSVPYARSSFRASLRDVVRRADEVEKEQDHRLPQMRPGSREYRADAERTLGTVDHLQKRLTTRRAQVRYWAGHGAWGKITKRDRETFRTARATAARLTALRGRAKRAVAVPIRLGFIAPPARKATPAKRRRWTIDDAYGALLDFTRENGRPPKASDLPGNPGLPSYAKVHDLFGGLSDVSRALRHDAASNT